MRDRGTDVDMTAENRRTRRTEAPLLAAQYFLDAQRSRSSGVRAIVLFDGPDVLVSSADSNRERAYSVAWAWDAISGATALERDVFVHPIEILGRPMYLATVDARLASVLETERALTRILSR
ncbi:MAG: hypothetical protein U0271_32490 [Polyangiaceae bacterium]